jgi:putative transposase
MTGIRFATRNGLRWRDASPGYSPHKTLHNRFVQSSQLGVFNRIFAGLAVKAAHPTS